MFSPKISFFQNGEKGGPQKRSQEYSRDVWFFNCTFVFCLLYWPRRSAGSSVVLRSQQFLYPFICVCFRGVQVDEKLFLMPCLKTYRICVAEICKGLTLLQNLTFKDLKR